MAGVESRQAVQRLATTDRTPEVAAVAREALMAIDERAMTTTSVVHRV